MVKIINKFKGMIKNSDKNNKTILYNIIGAFGVRGLAIIISLFTMPAYISYFNNLEVLGTWFTVLSVLSWILTFDLGIGNGLRNHLVSSLASKDVLATKKYISSAYIVVGSIVFLVMVISNLAFRFINWNMIFNISTNIISEETTRLAVTIVFSGIMLQFLLKLINSILFAMQQSALNNLLNLVSNIIILIYVKLAGAHNVEDNLIYLAIVNVLAVNMPLLLASVLIFYKNNIGFKPEIRYFDKEYAKDVMKLGGIFFWAQIMYMVIFSTNEFLITWFKGPEMVVEYQIYNKLFNLVGTIFILALTPIWSAVTMALVQQKYSWIRKLYRRLNLMALFGVVCEFCMVPFLQIAINLWLGDSSIKVNYLYAIVFAVSGSIFIWNGVLSSIANGFGELKMQSIFFTIGAIIKIPIAWILVEMFNSWIGVILANIIAMSLYCIMQPVWLSKFLDRKEFER